MDKDIAPSKPMVEKLVRLNEYEARLKDFFQENTVKIAFPFLVDKNKVDHLKSEYSKTDAFRQIFHDAYTKYMTAEDILNLIAFARSETGKKFVKFDDYIRADMQRMATELAITTAIEMVQDNIKKRRDDPGHVDFNLPEL